jgi:hypothetical protein
LNVLEHIQDDRLALRHMREVLAPGGHLVLIVPAHGWLYGTMDSAIGHFRRYDKAMLDRTMRQCGFTPIVQRHMNVLGSLGWFVNGRLLRMRVPPSGQLRLINRVTPILQTLERWVPPLFGLSLIMVAK